MSWLKFRRMNVYISPHPDDAMLSCGGRILQNRDKKQLVINVFTAIYKGKTEWDELCDLRNPHPMYLRIREDNKILSSLEVQCRYLNFLDQAVYKNIKDKPRPKSIIEKIEFTLRKKLKKIPKAKLFFPFGLAHQDHKVLREIGERIARDYHVCFYEDIPYALTDSISDWRFYKLTEESLKEKINLIFNYESQIPGLLTISESESEISLANKLKNHHREQGEPVEKIYKFSYT